MSPGGLGSMGSRLKPAAARIGRPTRRRFFDPVRLHRLSCCNLSAASTLRGTHLFFVHSEIVGHFVPDGVFHHAAQSGGAARQALVRSLKNGDAVGHGEGLENTASGERAAFIEAEQGAAGDARELGGGRLRLHQQRDVFQPLAEARGNAGVSGGYQAVEFVRAHGSCYSRSWPTTKRSAWG